MIFLNSKKNTEKFHKNDKIVYLDTVYICILYSIYDYILDLKLNIFILET